MAAGDLITVDTQVELRELLMGAETSYPITGPIDGLGDLEVRTTDLARPLDHGRFTGRSFYGSRVIRIPFAILGDTPSDAMAKLEDLGGAWRVPIPELDGGLEVPLVFRIGERRLTAIGKPSRVHVDATHLPKGRTITGLAEFIATDPRLYGDEQSASVSPGGITGGLSLPHSFPHGFGSAEPGALFGTNGGNFPTYPTITVTGGVGGLTQVSFEKTATGEVLAVDIVMNEGDTLELDFLERLATLNGTASRANLIERPADWFTLDPGDNTINFAVGSGTGTAQMVWRDAYVFG